MCGIWGLYHLDGAPVEAQPLLAMGAQLAHRGPDETGSWIQGAVGLGIHRLRVIDLVSGQQPVANEDGSITAVFNGEIYNYRELREELRSTGHRFKSQSDTEVIVHLYEEEGPACWSRLNGIFAVALWDNRRQELVLARDRFGIKPLYYHTDARRLVFGSELKPIFSALNGAAQVHLPALSDYLSLGYIPGPHAIFQGVRQVPPGHVVRCSAAGTTAEQYWDLRFSARAWASPRECEEALLEVARRAIRRQMVSDVPLGALLSGGVDSSLVVALMAQESAQPIQTFSVRFDEPSYDESAFARQVSRQFGTEHHEIVCDPKACLPWLPKLGYYADSLFADPSLVPTYLVCQAARRSVTVALSGDGGDELFAGYSTYQANVLLQRYQRLPGWARRAIAWSVAALPPSAKKLSASYTAKKFIAGAHLSRERAHYWWRTVFTEQEKARLVSSDVWQAMHSHDPFDAFGAWFAAAAPSPEPLDQFQHVDVRTWMAGGILTKLDRMSMAHSLEARVPWLDHELVEFASAIPAAWRMRGLQTKHLFKRAAARRLPPRVAFRKKAGFLPALSTWFHGPWRELLGDTLSSGALRQMPWLDAGAVRRLMEEHWASREDHSFKLWNLLMLCWWWQAMRQAEVETHTVGGGAWTA